MTGKRLVMWRRTDTFAEPSDKKLACRLLSISDADGLGGLLYAAYKGTVDDQGETLDDSKQEARETLSGKYGAVLWDCSFASFDGETMTSACVVVDRDGPFIPYVATHSEYKGTGLAKTLICKSINALLVSGNSEVRLVVTEANAAAVKLYFKLGFEELIQ